MSNEDYPSWGYMVKNGATTIWELWNGNTAAKEMNSGNHVMLVGGLTTWLYERLAGIGADSDQPGFKHVVMRPQPVPALTYVKASHESPYGTIRSEWEQKDGNFCWLIELPANTSATIYVPANEPQNVKEINSSECVERLMDEPGAAVFRIGSGVYRFEN